MSGQTRVLHDLDLLDHPMSLVRASAADPGWPLIELRLKLRSDTVVAARGAKAALRKGQWDRQLVSW